MRTFRLQETLIFAVFSLEFASKEGNVGKPTPTDTPADGDAPLRCLSGRRAGGGGSSRVVSQWPVANSVSMEIGFSFPDVPVSSVQHGVGKVRLRLMSHSLA